jgi:nickel-dependent lactate racemase
MLIHLAYGETGLDLNLPDGGPVTVIEPASRPGVRDPAAAVREALRHPIGSPPLRDAVPAGARIGIVFSDLTRPSPSRLLVQAILDELPAAARGRVTLFNAVGTHRPNTDDELRRMLGPEIAGAFRVVQNSAAATSSQARVGTTSAGHPVWLNRELVACDALVLTGFIEPHFFAGFSGGGKAVMPGMAGLATIMANHSAQMIGNPNATWGVTRGNPVWEEMQEAARMAGPAFLVNVTLNRQRAVAGVFAGDIAAAHAAGCAEVRAHAMTPTSRAHDIVIATNSGYPLDQNLYQAVKGMSAAARIVRSGGAIILAAECRDGIPDHGAYGRMLRESGSPRRFLESLGSRAAEQDQWQAQIQAQIQEKAEVHLYSTCLGDGQIKSAWLRPCGDIEATLRELRSRMGPDASIAVLPDGPQTIPYVAAP